MVCPKVSISNSLTRWPKGLSFQPFKEAMGLNAKEVLQVLVLMERFSGLRRPSLNPF